MTDSHNEDRSELLQGTLEMLILKMLAHEPMHGWGMSQRIQQVSREVILVSQGTLYPALQRMKRRGLIKSSWQITENNRRARYYELTAAGRKQLVVEQASWERAFTAVNWIMQMPIAGGAA
ncbi:MAG: PadR family transcriptional regulator [Gemmatimonadaceae bacterium]